jgi:hypothetical protein
VPRAVLTCARGGNSEACIEGFTSCMEGLVPTPQYTLADVRPSEGTITTMTSADGGEAPLRRWKRQARG